MNETSFELPPVSDIATAALAVGLLFLLRYGLAMRRAGAATPGDWLRGPKALAFGPDDEPSRRYAARQRVLGIVFLAIGATVFLWSVLRPAGG